MNTELPAGLAVPLSEAVRAARRRYRKRLEQSQKKFSESAVHDLRVEARRILALLDLLQALRFGTSLKKLARNFKRSLDTSDDLRDTQVQRCLLRPIWCDFPEARAFKSFLGRREKKLAAKADRKIQSARFTRLNRRLKEIEKCLARSQAPGNGQALASAILRVTFQRVVILRRQVRRQDPATIHRMRVAFKRYRYMCELLQPVLPELSTKRIARMKDYQAAAGNLQDLEVLLERLGVVVECGDLKRAEVSRLRSELLRRQRREINSFMKHIDTLFEFQLKPAPSRKGNRRG